jgi:hypothetical protein
MAKDKKRMAQGTQLEQAPVDPEPRQEDPEQVAEQEYRDQAIAEATAVLQEYFGDENASIKQLAFATGANYTALLKASKAPVSGQMYDPDNVNFGAMVQVLVRKNGIDALVDLKVDKLLSTGTDAPEVLLDVKVNDIVTLRPVENADGSVTKFPPYRVHIATPTHLVIMADGTSKPRVMSNATFKHSGGTVVGHADPEGAVDTEGEGA